VNPAYTLTILAAVGAGMLVARRTQGQLRLPPREKFGIALGGYCGAMIGAKLPFVFSDLSGLISGAAWFSDGKTILCGLAGGYFGVEIAKWCLDVRTKTGDSFAVPVAVSIAIGRVGCFIGGCCYGTPSALPWAVVFPHVDAQPRHPTQLYEALFHALCAGGLLLCLRRGLFRGQLIKLYFILYAAYRFLTEYLRPEIRLWGGLTGYQWASLLLIILFGWLWYRDVQLRDPMPDGAGFSPSC
jgi:phosphatidylglycerol---prolipoprotein diacylglyceryl transferase